MWDKVTKKVIFFALFIGFFTLVSAEIEIFGDEEDYVINIEIPEPPINYSLVPTVNSSDFWDDLDTPADISIFCLLTGCQMSGDLIIENSPDIVGDGLLDIYSSTGKAFALRIDDDGSELQLTALGSSTIEVQDNLNSTGKICDTDGCIGDGIGDGVQNNTAGWNVNFTNTEITQFYTPTNSFPYTIDDDGSNVNIDFPTVGGNNYAGISTSGGFFQIYANPNPSNDYLLATITETQGADTEMNFYEGGTTHNRFWSSGSVRIGGDASRLCSNLTTDVDCDTPLTGADLVVQDDTWTGGEVFTDGVILHDGGNITSNGTCTIIRGETSNFYVC